MRVDGQLWLGQREYLSSFARSSVVVDDALDVGIGQQFRSYDTDLVYQEVDAGAIFYDVLVIASVARNHHRVAVVFDTIAHGGLDGCTVIDRKGNHFDAIPVIDDA